MHFLFLSLTPTKEAGRLKDELETTATHIFDV